MTRVQLNWYDPNEDQAHEYIGDLPITFGRNSTNTVVLNGMRVSRNHARLEDQNGQLVLIDLDSSNGIEVNGNRLKNQQVAIQDGSQFMIDPFEITLKTLQGVVKQQNFDGTLRVRLPPPLNKLKDRDSMFIQTSMEHIVFPPGAVIFRQGDPTDGCYIIDRGLVRLEIAHENSNPDENEDVLAFVEPDSFLGELSLLDRSTRFATAIAHGEVEARKISVELFEKLTQEYPAIAISLLTALGRSAAERLRQTTRQLDNLTSAKYDAKVEAMIADAEQAQRQIMSWSEERIDDLLQAIAAVGYENAEALAQAAVQETQMGNIIDKTLKNRVASAGVLQSLIGKSGFGLGANNGSVVEIANPVGIIFGLVPATNPTSTFIFKTLIAIKSRNALILSPNRRAEAVSNSVGEMIRNVLIRFDAPEKLVQWIDARSSRKLTVTFMAHKKTGLILATGGSAMVKAAYSSGNPAIGVGPGNAPVFIHPTADLQHAARCIIMSKSFDNGLICGSEHNLVVEQSILGPFIQALVANGAAVLSEEEAQRFTASIIDAKLNGFKESAVGKDAATIAADYDISRPYPIRLIVVPATDITASNPYAHEKMLPVLSLFTAADTEQALSFCHQLLAIDGTGHTAIIYAQDQALIERFGIEMPASRILVNSPGAHGVVGISTELIPSLTLGCGTFGGTSTTDNVTYTHLMNVKRMAHFVPQRIAEFVNGSSS